VLKNPISPTGYYTTILSRDGKAYSLKVHRIVLEAFKGGPRGDRNYVNHINGDKLDNRPGNLEWVTNGENSRHARLTGLTPDGKRGAEANGAKLTEAQVTEIRKLLASRELKGYQIAERYGVSPATITRIKQGHTYC